MKDKLIEAFDNKLIVFEGADLTGKTTVAKLFNNYLNNMDIEAVFTFQPGDGAYSQIAPLMRSFCKDSRWNLHPLANFFAFQMDRVEQVDKVIYPALSAGATVISDRWTYSTRAYQLRGKGLDKNMPEAVSDWLLKEAVHNLKPDIVFYFPNKLSVDREQNINDEFENQKQEFFKRVHKEYEYLATKFGWQRVEVDSDPKITMQNMVDRYIYGEK